MSTGVYKITCAPTGKIYIGSAARSLEARRKRHWADLRGGRHHSINLQRSWNKYGESAFTFTPVLLCRPQDALMYEQLAFEALKPTLNMAPTAGNLSGFTHSIESRRKIAEYPRTPEMRLRQSAAMRTGRKLPTRRWKVATPSRTRKVGEADVRAMRYVYDNRLASMRHLARHYGLDHHTVSDIVHRITWGDV